VPQKHLTAPRLADAIRQATEHVAMRQAAVTLGRALRCEDGAAQAVSSIERIVAGRRLRRQG
jgi:sterol 3beta-glucosyltransferase